MVPFQSMCTPIRRLINRFDTVFWVYSRDCVNISPFIVSYYLIYRNSKRYGRIFTQDLCFYFYLDVLPDLLNIDTLRITSLTFYPSYVSIRT